ncbi:chromatin accessibility complex protein 1-like [Artemia franciscana]|uniref:chromatin accessibility complex protein 1-like n=1 Tax=Artemia franciscana TaxID=6661 RepID=UPI0032DB193B
MKDQIQIPISKVRTIMKACPEVENLGQDALFLAAKAAEIFIVHLTKLAYQDGKDLEYKNLASVVQEKDEFDFLKELLPFKKKLSDCFDLISESEKKQVL